MAPFTSSPQEWSLPFSNRGLSDNELQAVHQAPQAAYHWESYQIPKKKAHVQFKKWADEDGPVYSLVLGTTIMIVLSFDVAIKDLFEKRSGIYSSRPHMYIGSLASGGFAWSSWLVWPYQDLESTSMMVSLLDNPDLGCSIIFIFGPRFPRR